MATSPFAALYFFDPPVSSLPPGPLRQPARDLDRKHSCALEVPCSLR
jgi:hypothetical protein